MAGILDRYRREPSGLWLPRMFGLAGTAYGWCESCCGGVLPTNCDPLYVGTYPQYLQIDITGATSYNLYCLSSSCAAIDGTYLLYYGGVENFSWVNNLTPDILYCTNVTNWYLEQVSLAMTCSGTQWKWVVTFHFSPCCNATYQALSSFGPDFDNFTPIVANRTNTGSNCASASVTISKP